MQKIKPCLWFDGQAEEAAKFYISVFKDGKIREITHYGKSGPRPEGSVMTVEFELFGQEFMGLNGGPEFKFNEALSLTVACKTQEEIDELWEKLSRGGQEVECGWLKDKYGLFWQIVPAEIPKMLSDPDPEKVNRVMEAVMTMKKLDIAALKQAYEGTPVGARR
jgi:predicted 3-demethylubiquinone-9 3-methyltransferase (glyoxalase superfamily)